MSRGKKTTKRPCPEGGGSGCPKPLWWDAISHHLTTPISSNVIARAAGVTRRTVDRWLNRLADETGEVQRVKDSHSFTSNITGGRPPSLWVLHAAVQKGGEGGVQKGGPSRAQILVKSTAALPPIWRDGVFYRVHNDGYVTRLVGPPRTHPLRWGLVPVREPWGSLTDGGARGCHLRLGHGWRLKYDEGPQRHTATIYPPQEELVDGSRLPAYLRERERVMWRVWRSLRLWFGTEGWPEEPPHMHIAVPHAIPELAAEAGEVVFGLDGQRLLWQDRSQGRLELEGTRPVMAGLASLPERFDRQDETINGLAASIGQLAAAIATNGTGASPAPPAAPQRPTDEPEGYG